MPDDSIESSDGTQSTSLTELARKTFQSRRGFLAGSAALGTSALGLSTVGSSVAAQDGEGEGDGGGSGSSGGGDGDGVTDLEVLNYALTLEHLEATFYRKGLEDFSDEEFINADLVCGLCPEVRQMIPEHVKVVSKHEDEHVESLTAAIEGIGGDPVGPDEYDFGYTTPGEFLELAMTLENTGVSAYAGAAPSLEEDAYLSAALSIHSVEARHAAIFNGLNGQSPFPDSFDQAKSMEDIVKAIDPLIVSND